MAFNKELHKYMYSEINEFKEGTVFKGIHKEYKWITPVFEIVRKNLNLDVAVVDLNPYSEFGKENKKTPIGFAKFKELFNVGEVLSPGYTSYILNDDIAVTEKPWERLFIISDGKVEETLSLTMLKRITSSIELGANSEERSKSKSFYEVAAKFLRG